MEPNQSYLESVRILGIVLHNPDNAEFIIDRLRAQYGAWRQHPVIDLRYTAIAIMKSYQMDYSLVLVEPQSEKSNVTLTAYMDSVEALQKNDELIKAAYAKRVELPFKLNKETKEYSKFKQISKQVNNVIEQLGVIPDSILYKDNTLTLSWQVTKDVDTVKDIVKNALIAKIRSLENLLDSI